MDATGRDLGLNRLSRITRWLVGGAVVLTGALSALVAQARPGHAKSATTSSPTTVPATGDGVIQPPVQPPSAGAGGGVVVSGAS